MKKWLFFVAFVITVSTFEQIIRMQRLYIEPWLFLVPAWAWIVIANVANALDAFTTFLFLKNQQDFDREGNPIALFVFKNFGFRIMFFIKVAVINGIIWWYWHSSDRFLMMFLISLVFGGVTLWNSFILYVDYSLSFKESGERIKR